MPQPIRTTFAAGESGAWRIERIAPVIGPTLAPASRLGVIDGHPPTEGAWVLRGVTSNHRYVARTEKDAIAAVQPVLGRTEATRAALIPISKSEAWWELPQDERRAIFEDQSHHIAASMKYMPAIARRLHHGRELGEPFDFLTWFEYAPSAATQFEELVAMLRETEEWRYVIAEVDVRLSR